MILVLSVIACNHVCVAMALPLDETSIGQLPLVVSGAPGTDWVEVPSVSAPGFLGASTPPLEGSHNADGSEFMPFSLNTEDGTVKNALHRWGDQAGWTVIWDTSIVAQITGSSRVQGAFPIAVTEVIQSLRRAGYPLWVSPEERNSRTLRVFQTISNVSVLEIQR